jgi:hypothetical protein
LTQAGKITARRQSINVYGMCKTQEPDATVYSHTDTHTSRSFHVSFHSHCNRPHPRRQYPRQPSGLAADELHYNQISLRAEVSQEVARDLMIVTLYTEAQNTDPAKLAAEITTTMNKALAQAREVKA